MSFDQSDAIFLLDQLPDLVLLLNYQGTIYYANQRTQELLGDEDLIGKPFCDLVDEQDLARLPQQPRDWSDWRSTHGLPWEIRIRRADGQLQLVSGSAKELFLPSESDNKQSGLIALRPIGGTNSTNIRRDLLMAAIEAADSSIVVADASQEDLPLIYVNQGFLELSGYDEAEVLGQNCRFLQFRHQDASSRDDDQPGLAQIREALKAGKSINVILRNYRQDGSQFYNELYLTPVYEHERLVAFVGVQNDITKRVQAQQQLREREGFFAATEALLGIVEIPPSAPIRHVVMNAQAERFFQVEETAETELASSGFLPEIQAQRQEAFEKCLQTRQVVRFKCEPERLGERRHLRVTVNPNETEPGAAPRCCYVAEDITDLNKAETNRMLMEAAVENTEESLVITTSELDASKGEPEIIYVNRTFTEMTGYEREEAIGQTLRMLQGPMTDPSVLARLHKELIETQSFRGETINYRKDGQPYIMEWNIAPILDEGGEVAYWVAAQRDVTQRRQLEKEVLESQAREQERIARDLHDSVQQQLNVVGMLAGLIGHQLGKEITPEVKRLLDRLFNTVQQAADQVRAISHSLYSVSIERNGLMLALQHLATTTQEVFIIDCEFAFEQPILLDDYDKATHLYRIVQEAINNAIRHGQAKQILIGLAKNYQDQYTLTISDNGIGISDNALKAGKGMGLNSMRYRAEMIDANFSIERGNNGGTVVTCTFNDEKFSSRIDELNSQSDSQ